MLNLFNIEVTYLSCSALKWAYLTLLDLETLIEFRKLINTELF